MLSIKVIEINLCKLKIGMISQWQEKNKGIQEESLASTRGSAETIEMYFMHLYRFDMGLEFHYRRSLVAYS